MENDQYYKNFYKKIFSLNIAVCIAKLSINNGFDFKFIFEWVFATIYIIKFNKKIQF